MGMNIQITNVTFHLTEREVKKATRDLTQLLNTIELPMHRLETVSKKYTELFADMKRLDRDHSKSKKRADQLQKDHDKGKSDLSKTITMKDKLEKLCRELTKENKKVKVGQSVCVTRRMRPSNMENLSADLWTRTRTRSWRTPRRKRA